MSSEVNIGMNKYPEPKKFSSDLSQNSYGFLSFTHGIHQHQNETSKSQQTSNVSQGKKVMNN